MKGSALPGGGAGFRMAPSSSTPVRTSGELEEQLRRRLRIKSIIWAYAAGLLALTACLVRREHVRADPVTLFTEPPLPGVLLLLFAMTLVAIRVLSTPGRLKLTQLRAIEWTGLAAIAAFFLINQWRQLLGDLPELSSNPMDLGVAFGTPWGLLIIAYGVLIPSSLRHGVTRTAVLLACAYVADVIVLPHVDSFGPGIVSYLALKTIVLTVASALSLYGAYRIEALGNDAMLARQLGQYVLREEIGAGGMGSVYLAEHRFLRRPCAVKLISADHARDHAARARFEREVQSAAELTHPNTVQIYDYGQSEDGIFYFAMEYLRGLSLEQLVDQDGPLPPARAVRILVQLCGALREAHGLGLVHRDIKPANVMLCQLGGRQDVVKLFDFGIVAAARGGNGEGRITQTGMLLGTPAFMSPEQCMGDSDVGPASDLYSVGALGYFLLTGHEPFGDRTIIQLLAAHMYETPTPIRDTRPDVSVELEAVIARCLAKSLSERFVDATSLEQALLATLSEPGEAGKRSLSLVAEW